MSRVVKPVVLSLTLMILVAAPGLAETRKRTEMITYDSPSGAHVMDHLWVEVGPVPETRPARGESAVAVVLEDNSGRPVAGVVHQGKHTLAEICGATEAPVPLMNRQPVHVHIYSGPACGDVSLPTQGTATFTFTG